MFFQGGGGSNGLSDNRQYKTFPERIVYHYPRSIFSAYIRMKNYKLFILTFFILLFSFFSCKGVDFPSVSAVSGAWLAIKTELITLNNNPPNRAYNVPAEKLEADIADFRTVINRFLNSPVGSLYQLHRPEELQSLRLDNAVRRLENALRSSFESGNIGEVFSITLEIDTAIDHLQQVDNNLSDISQLRYFQLFFFFSLLIIIIVLALSILYGRLEKAKTREQQSLAFSRETVIAQEQERSRLARELHDTVAQDLWRLSFQTDSIDKAEPQERRRLCAEVVKGQKDIMRRIRDICDNLIPPDFQRRGLLYALKNLCYNFEKRNGFECQLTVQNNLRLGGLDSDMQLQCFRIVQECLANTEKHAAASEASVLVRNSAEGELLISVSDNGRGFSPPDIDSYSSLRAGGHFGLWSIYERAASLSGTLVTDSGIGEGTVITLRIPINK